MSSLIVFATHISPHSWWGGWASPWWIVFPLLWIVLIATVIWLVARTRGRSSLTERPAEILAARYARGEIDTDEYRRRLDEIRGLS
jgi:putative membrane protein